LLYCPLPIKTEISSDNTRDRKGGTLPVENPFNVSGVYDDHGSLYFIEILSILSTHAKLSLTIKDKSVRGSTSKLSGEGFT
jgi:hypothetical protein